MLIELYRYATKISRMFAVISGVGLLAVSAFMMVSIVMRYHFLSPILGDIEIVEVTLTVVVFSSFAYTQTEKGHIHVVMVLRLLPKKLRLVIFALNSFLVTAVSAAVVYGCIMQGNFVLRRRTVSAMLHLPLYPFYYFAAVCMAVFTAALLLDAIMAAAGIFSPKYAEHVQKSWV